MSTAWIYLSFWRFYSVILTKFRRFWTIYWLFGTFSINYFNSGESDSPSKLSEHEKIRQWKKTQFIISSWSSFSTERFLAKISEIVSKILARTCAISDFVEHSEKTYCFGLLDLLDLLEDIYLAYSPII